MNRYHFNRVDALFIALAGLFAALAWALFPVRTFELAVASSSCLTAVTLGACGFVPGARTRRAGLVAAVACLALWFVGCSVYSPVTATATGGNATTGGGAQCFDPRTGEPIVCPNGPGSGGSAGNLPADSFVRVGLFGLSCPAGTTPPANALRQIPLNCRGFVTATPKRADGTDHTAAEHGPNCSWSVTHGQGIVNVTAPTEVFNRDVSCAAAGDFGLQATVKNLVGSTDFACTPTSAPRALTGLRASAEIAGSRVLFWNELDEDGRPLATARLKDLARLSERLRLELE